MMRIILLAIAGAVLGFIGALAFNFVVTGTLRPEDTFLYLAIGAIVGGGIGIAEARRR